MKSIDQIKRKWNNLDPISRKYLLGILESLDFAQQNMVVSSKLSKVKEPLTKPPQEKPA